MNILILGSGGREHAFAWKLAQSNICDQLFVAPGNAGTAQVATNVPLNPEDFDQIKQFVLQNQIKLVLVGPEVPLVQGIKDYFREDEALQSVYLIGPDRRAAALEGSKDFAKYFMQKYQIPTATYRTFELHTLEEGLLYLTTLQPPFVLKADGLAAGKGVIIVENLHEAQQHLREMLQEQKFGAASTKVLIEEFLRGIEVSVFVLTDGQSYKILPEAKDYKRIGEGDTGPNTGGMGAVSPVPFADQEFMEKVKSRIIQPTMQGLQAEKMDYSGFIFFGLINVHGEPYVIEYNIRMGDPETQVVMPRLLSDFGEMLWATAQKRLAAFELLIKDQITATTVLVSGGYPGKYEKGKEISHLDILSEDVIPFHAGTIQKNNTILTDGGRVMSITAQGDTLEEVMQKCQKAANLIQFEGKYFRKDIGQDLLHQS